MHGQKDNIVPVEMSYTLLKLIKGEKYSYFPEKDDHMMEYNTELIENVKKFIYKLN